MKIVHHGMNRVDLDAVLLALGGQVFVIRGTGDIAYVHDLMPRRVRSNGRRKDAARELTKFVMRLQRVLDKTAANEDNFSPPDTLPASD